MREILFRGKLKNGKGWSYGNLNISVTGVCIMTPDDTPVGRYGQVIPETVGQYTGLHDMNGKRIFEGDILESFINGEDETRVKVVWHNSGFCAQQGDLEPNPIEEYEDWWEVIGNIHDNPELPERNT